MGKKNEKETKVEEFKEKKILIKADKKYIPIMCTAILIGITSIGVAIVGAIIVSLLVAGLFGSVYMAYRCKDIAKENRKEREKFEKLQKVSESAKKDDDLHPADKQDAAEEKK